MGLPVMPLREFFALAKVPFVVDRRRAVRDVAPLLAGAALLVAIDMGLSAATTPEIESEAAIGSLYAIRFVLASLYVVALCRRGASPSADFGIDRSRLREDARWSAAVVVTGALVTAAIAILAAAILAAAGSLPQLPASVEKMLDVTALLRDLPRTLGDAAAALVAAPLQEELVYRAILLPPLLMLLPAWVAIAVNALVFAFLHAVPYGFGWFVPAQLLGGVLMSIAFCARHSIVPAILVHSAGNLVLACGGVLYANLPRVWPTLFA